MSKTPCFVAREFDLRRGEFTGREETYCADSPRAAAEALAYTRNLRQAGWTVGFSGRTVVRPSGDRSWHVTSETALRRARR